MPWSAEGFKKFKADLTDAEARRAAAQANAILRACLAEGGKTDDCERIAIATALKNINKEREERKQGRGSVAQVTADSRAYIHTGGKMKGKRLPNGILYLEEIGLTKAKVYEYEDENGKTVYELLPESEVTSEKFLSSCVGLPITLGHPAPGQMVDASNLERVICGLTGSKVRVQDGLVIVDGYIFNEKAIRAIEEGNDEVSIGYLARTVEKDGEYKGERYQAIQEVIELNHVAVGLAAGQGRCGRECVIMTNAMNLKGSYEERHKMLMEALRKKYPEYGYVFPFHILGVWEDHIVFGRYDTDEYYQAPYSISEDGTVTIGEAVKGSLEFIGEEASPASERASEKKAAGKEPAGEGENMMTLNVQGLQLRLDEKLDPQKVKDFQKAIDSLSNEHADLVKRARAQETLNSKLEAKNAIIESLQEKCKIFEERVHALESGKALENLVSEKLSLIREAEQRINGYQFQGKSNVQIMIDVIKSISPKFDEKGKSEQTIREVYHALLEHEQALEGAAALKSVKGNAHGTPKRDLSEELAEWREKIKGRSAQIAKPTK